MGAPLDRRTFVRCLGQCALASAGAGLGLLSPPEARAAAVKKGLAGRRRASWFTTLDEQAVRCELCPHHCRIEPGRRGRCGVRENQDGSLWSLVYGNPCAVNIDPIEKKPFHHVLPGTRTLSVATAGCNLHCGFCQNWEVSQVGPEETFNYELPPAEAVARAELYACRSVASSYVEPVVFMEYMLDVARRCRAGGLLHLMHSAGYVNEAPLREASQFLDAACIDLKGFSDDFYRKLVGGGLRPVLKTLEVLKSNGVHTEVVNLLIPGKNDDMGRLRAMGRWIARELGPETPLHFYRFYPRYKLTGVPPTPVLLLERARAVAMEQGLHYVYIVNVPEHPAKHTWCPECGEVVIRRVGFDVEPVGLVDGRCKHCGHVIPGVWSSGGLQGRPAEDSKQSEDAERAQ